MNNVGVWAVLLLGGCAAAMPSIAPPTIADVAARSAALTATKLSPAEYFAVGSLMVGESCHGFFRTLGDQAAQLDLAGAELGLATGAAAGIGAVAGLDPIGVAVTAIAGTLLQGTLINTRSSPVPFPTSTANLVNKALAEYIAAAPEPTTLGEAAMLVDSEAWLCSVPGANWLAHQAVVTAVPMAAGIPSRGLLATRRRAVPPVIEITR